MTKHQQPAQCQAGFTLVELAIVMIIIGLLIGGVLKGQQLITNAQITATVAQIKAIDAATTSFRDQYNTMPGDMLNPANRLNNCVAANNCTAGAVASEGDGKINNAAGGTINFGAVAAGEQLAYWSQLNLAGLITGVNPGAAGTAWGLNYPASKLSGGGFDIGYNAGGAASLTGVVGAALVTPSGHFLALHGTANAVVAGAATDSFMTPNQAARIDTKIDDSAPNSGTVWAAAQTAANCTNGALVTSIYSENLTATGCSLYIQFQN